MFVCLSSVPSIAVFLSISTITLQIITFSFSCISRPLLSFDLWIFLPSTEPIFKFYLILGIFILAECNLDPVVDGEAESMRKGCLVRNSHVLACKVRQLCFLGTPNDCLWRHLFQSLLWIFVVPLARALFIFASCAVNSVSLVLREEDVCEMCSCIHHLSSLTLPSNRVSPQVRIVIDNLIFTSALHFLSWCTILFP